MAYELGATFAPAIQNGIFTGLMLSLGLMVYRGMYPRVALLGLHADGTYRLIPDTHQDGVE